MDAEYGEVETSDFHGDASRIAGFWYPFLGIADYFIYFHASYGFMKEEKNSDLRIAAPFIHPHPSARNHTPCASHRNGVPLQKFKTITQCHPPLPA